MEKPAVVLDLNERPVEPGGIYRLLAGGNALVVEIMKDGEHFAAIPSFFAGFFRVDSDPHRIDALAGHCKFVPFNADED